MRSNRAVCSLSAEFALVKETILTQNERITQLYVIQSQEDPFLWFGILFVDTGFYAGSVIRFIVNIDESYPDCSCPRVVFEPPPYHPLVDPHNGKLDTKNAFPHWNSNTHKLHQLLLFVKRVIHNSEMYIKQIQELIRQDILLTSESQHNHSSNLTRSQDVDSAGMYPHSGDLTSLFDNFSHTLECIRLYELEPHQFHRRIDDFKRKCSHKLFDRPQIFGDDQNAPTFTPWDPEVLEPVRKCILDGRFAPASLFASYHKDTDSVSFIPGSESTR